ncbi:hypothetical protein [Sphingobium fluviale]|uniref:Uncharacterized protein n=1 Tax=Sphingobium fluviale TaxID=2506423 RepID=A0A4Q1KHE0_9SPHN|nr:hypothetical protein [Sphingobium fluviale]RXR28977.1 hypothetical protein EQG66_07820 [Sphingobium fluviale]
MAVPFKVGDIVTRDGTDLQKIIEINDVGDLILVECVKEPLGYLNDDGSRGTPWCAIGEQEWNLSRRYEHAGTLVDGLAHPLSCETGPPPFAGMRALGQP